MSDLMTVFSMVLIVSPIVIGCAAFGLVWLRDEFYEDSFYDDYETDC